MALLLGTELGLEDISREIGLLLISNINSYLATIDTAAVTKDQELATARGDTYIECTSNTVDPSHVHVGSRPSLIENPVENYPNIAIMSYSSNRSNYGSSDQAEDSQIVTYIEAMVIDGPFNSDLEFNATGEDQVNKKMYRMVEAIHGIILDNKTLNGIVYGFEDTPAIFITDCLRRSAHTEADDYDYYWQFARLEYKFIKTATYRNNYA